MTRHPTPHPSKHELREMSLEQLDAYIGSLRRALEWMQSGPVHVRKVRTKQLEVAIKSRDLRYPDYSDGRARQRQPGHKAKTMNSDSENVSSQNVLVAQLDARLQPIHRAEFFENQLNEALSRAALGKVTGGGTFAVG